MHDAQRPQQLKSSKQSTIMKRSDLSAIVKQLSMNCTKVLNNILYGQVESQRNVMFSSAQAQLIGLLATPQAITS